MHANTDYYNNYIEDLQGEMYDLEEQRDEYKSHMEDLECELKEANEAYELLMKENAKLKNLNESYKRLNVGAFMKINELYKEIGGLKAKLTMEDLVREAQKDEE